MENDRTLPQNAPQLAWISVETEMPADYLPILFFTSEKKFWEVGQFNGEKFECERTDGYNDAIHYDVGQVTHWMPVAAIPLPGDPLPPPQARTPDDVDKVIEHLVEILGSNEANGVKLLKVHGFVTGLTIRQLFKKFKSESGSGSAPQEAGTLAQKLLDLLVRIDKVTIWDCVSNGRSLQEEIEQYTLPELRKLAERGVPLEETKK